MIEKNNTILTFRKMKKQGEKITVLTAYDYLTANLLDNAGIDAILVGDSAASVILGYDNTIPITMEEMLMLTKAVCRGVKRALVIADMPFMSYQVNKEQALQNASRFLKEVGAGAVKLEGGKIMADTINFLTSRSIPIIGHIGLTPQSILQFGSYRVRGRKEEEARKLLEDAHILQEAGCFAIVLEKIPYKLAKKISEELTIPTIGIGAGPYCDGQVLVVQDMLGLLPEFQPKFLKQYADLSNIMTSAFIAAT